MIGKMLNNGGDISSPDSTGDHSSGMLQKLGVWGRLKWVLTGRTYKGGELNRSLQTGDYVQPGIWNLRQLRVEDVMVPQADIKSVPMTITKEDLVDVFRDNGLTRLPVYNRTLDTPLGFVNLKDVALKHGFNASGGRFVLKTMLRPLIFVPPSMPIGVLLTKMQADRIHIA